MMKFGIRDLHQMLSDNFNFGSLKLKINFILKKGP